MLGPFRFFLVSLQIFHDFQRKLKKYLEFENRPKVLEVKSSKDLNNNTNTIPELLSWLITKVLKIDLKGNVLNIILKSSETILLLQMLV